MIAVVVGAATPPGRLARAAATMAEIVQGQGTRADLLDLSRTPVEMFDGREPALCSAATRSALDLFAAAQGVVLASPVYRGTITGALKNLLDHLPVAALKNKPVGLVVVGASLHHYLGVQSHLQDIMSWFGALLLPTQVYLSAADFVEGELREPAVASLAELASTLLAVSQRLHGIQLSPIPLAMRGRS